MAKQRKDQHLFSKGRQFRILGIGKQEVIKYFFGGNATLAIIIILGIIAFLVYNAYKFFPDYKKSLTLYRLSGQEYVDFMAEEYNKVNELKSSAIQAREYEIQKRLGALYRVSSIYSEFKGKVNKTVKPEKKELERAKAALENAQEKPGELQAARERLAKVTEEFESAVQKSVQELDYSDVENKSWKTDDKYLEPIRAAVTESILTGKTPAFIKDVMKQEQEETAKIDTLPALVKLKEAGAIFGDALPAYKKYVEKLRKIADQNKQQVVFASSAAGRKQAQVVKLELASTPEEKKKIQIDIDRILLDEPNYAKLNEPIYNSLAMHKQLQTELGEAVKKGEEVLPEKGEFQSEVARKRIREMRDIAAEMPEIFSKQRQKLESWKHDADYPMSSVLGGFFFGKQWITNSSWQDKYGVVPLLAGSVSVAILAIVVAVPFAVGGAIYVNRLSSKAEQSIIKPFIEFIQAIPSIVLAFFGYVVLGSLIQKYSQYSLFSWLPGFPVESPYTILNAGLLLALMSVPTIFTLCEDALNNVPKAYNEASLALGATKLQTVIQVILPACASGIFAAVLLGFGRIIGETMVVLLVLGGRIAIPESFTDPAHSMTGILAQEIGEVDKGSLHWGALFMVGLVLFTIALLLNFIAQRVLQKYTKNG